MTSHDIRQSFLDFFREKQHRIVPSSSLLPDAPNLLFTNAGMNQFVPIFLGQVPCPYRPPRAVDTQKCIRAGGKHNDLEDVGLDTYHHTLFEMLGNWSFGEASAADGVGAGYFKREAIDWAWELLVERWHFPPQRLYATYFGGDEKVAADTEARDLWLRHLPADRVVPGNRKDNFWMMGDTGPCGPCSEIHMDLTPAGDGGAALVNAGSARCIEIWNLVFIQFNANPDGSLTSLAAKHVDTGMGFERVCGIIQGTDGLRDFSRPISNYVSDVFTPLFRELERLSGRFYGGELANPVDIAFRVIADHIRCLAFAVADGILPSNEGRGYVLRRILRRAVRYGRALGFHEPFFFKLVGVVVDNFGGVFPELRQRREAIETTLRAEEENFNRTLDRGIEIFEQTTADLPGREFPADQAFKLYDTYGFPIDLTELMARERGLAVDVAGFERLMEGQRQRAREDHDRKKTIIAVDQGGLDVKPTRFIGYDQLEAESVIEAVIEGAAAGELHLILDRTPFYAEMGGQVGDTGRIGRLEINDTQKQGETFVHRARCQGEAAPEVGDAVMARVDTARRAHIQQHHTVTHLFHWALHEVVSREARQRGSLVAPDRLRFDFNHPERLSEQQLADIERLVNERIRENAPVSWFEMPYEAVKGNPQVMQFFGDKYGDRVRIVQVGGHPGQLDGFSMELCGGTHTKTTAEIGSFKIARESAIAAGIRRVEAVCGEFAVAYQHAAEQAVAAEAARAQEREQEKEQARQRQASLQQQAPSIARELLPRLQDGLLVANLGEGNATFLRAVIDALKPLLGSGVVVLGAAAEGKVALLCYVTADLVKQGRHAGKIVGAVAKLCGGGGGGKPDLAQAGGKQPDQLENALAAAPAIVRG